MSAISTRLPGILVLDLGELFYGLDPDKKLTTVSLLQLVKAVVKETIYLIHEVDVSRILSNREHLSRFIDIVLDSCEYIDQVGPLFSDENVLARKIVEQFLNHISRAGYLANGKFPYRLERMARLVANSRGAHLKFYFVYDRILDDE